MGSNEYGTPERARMARLGTIIGRIGALEADLPPEDADIRCALNAARRMLTTTEDEMRKRIYGPKAV